MRFPLARMKARMSHRLLLFVWMAGILLAGMLIVLGHKLHLIADRWAMSPDEHRDDDCPIGPRGSLRTSLHSGAEPPGARLLKNAPLAVATGVDLSHRYDAAADQ